MNVKDVPIVAFIMQVNGGPKGSNQQTPGKTDNGDPGNKGSGTTGQNGNGTAQAELNEEFAEDVMLFNFNLFDD